MKRWNRKKEQPGSRHKTKVHKPPAILPPFPVMLCHPFHSPPSHLIRRKRALQTIYCQQDRDKIWFQKEGITAWRTNFEVWYHGKECSITAIYGNIRIIPYLTVNQHPNSPGFRESGGISWKPYQKGDILRGLKAGYKVLKSAWDLRGNL